MNLFFGEAFGVLEDNSIAGPVTVSGGQRRFLACHIHSPYWPYHRIATLQNAMGIARSWTSMATGRGKFTLPWTDPTIVRDPGILDRGSFVVIESTLLPGLPWVGFVQSITESDIAGALSVDMLDALALADTTPTQQAGIPQSGAGNAFFQVLKNLNGKGHSGLFTAPSYDPGPPVVLSLSAQTALKAMGDVHDQSGYEYWVSPVEVSSSHIRLELNFGYRQGLDRSDIVVLSEGYHLSSFERVLDTSGLRQSMTVVGGSGPLSGRTSVTRGAGPGSQSHGIGTVVEPASELYNRLINIPPALRSGGVLFRGLTTDRPGLSLEAQRALEQQVGASERYKVVVNTRADWMDLQLGDYIRVIKTSHTGIGPMNRKVRITGTQPDEEAGEMVLTIETPIS